MNDLNNLLGATYAAVFFLGAANLLTLLPVVSVERTVFYREKAAGMYSPLSYAFAQVSSEHPYKICLCIYRCTMNKVYMSLPPARTSQFKAGQKECFFFFEMMPKRMLSSRGQVASLLVFDIVG